MSFNTTTLLNMIERRAAIPISQSTFTEDEILEIANEVVSDIILPDILKARQDFFVVWEDLTPIQGTNDNDPWIRIPTRAIGQTIINLSEPDNDFELNQCAYWIEGSKIYLDTERSYPVRVRYHLRPGQLVEVGDCAVIQSITNNGATTDIVVNAVPQEFTTNLTYDIIRGNAAFDLLKKDIAISAINGTTITIASSNIPSELQAGDYLCQADQSPVPQIPVEWFSYLAQHVAAVILEANGDYEAAKKIESKLGVIRNNALSLIGPRIQSKSKAIK